MTADVSDARLADAALAGNVFDAGESGSERAASVARPAAQPSVEHAASRDRQAYVGRKPAMLEYLRHAQHRSGRRPLDLVREFYRLNRGRGRLPLAEYVQYGVYDTARCSPDEQSRFITNALHWPITHICCDMTWQATTEDKWLCSHILARSAIRVPETLAVIDKSERVYPGTRKIASAHQLREFVTARDVVPFFGKENRGICSFGAFLVEHADDRAVHLKGHGPLPYDVFLDQFVGGTSYLLQRLETNHAFFAPYTGSLATVRVCILLDKAGLRIPFAVLKLPSRENLADSFWRPGNLACRLDVESGTITGVRSKDALGTTEHETHPESGAPIVGERLPMWDRLLDLVHRCAPIFHPVRYQSMDIALTPHGPVLIEINTGGGFDLPQLASGRGFLTDEVREFFRACGYARV
jgi:hypothetical protein